MEGLGCGGGCGCGWVGTVRLRSWGVGLVLALRVSMVCDLAWVEMRIQARRGCADGLQSWGSERAADYISCTYIASVCSLACWGVGCCGDLVLCEFGLAFLLGLLHCGLSWVMYYFGRTSLGLLSLVALAVQ